MASVRQRFGLAAIAVVAGLGWTTSAAQPALGDGPFWSNDCECEPQSPVGTRQRCRHGKLWPPFPRPTGDHMGFWEAYHATSYWPWPYVCWDRQSVLEHSAVQVANGWITEATLYDYHFDPHNPFALNQAGRLHLQWILQNVPPDRRCAWVQAATDSGLSQQRLAAVRNEAIALVGEDNVPAVMLRVDTPYGRPATEIQNVQKSYLGSMPQPRIVYDRPKFAQQ